MKCLAIDIGAESGRGIVGEIRGGKLHFEEVHRFANIPLRVSESLRWNVPELLREIRIAIDACNGIESVGVDTWAVDFALLGADGALLELPYHYRDSRNDGVMQRAFEVVSRERIYEQTGIQFLPFNTLYQLYGMKCLGSESLTQAESLLMMPDYLHYELMGGGSKEIEFTNATTTQCFNPVTGDWAFDLLDDLGIPTKFFPETVLPGTCLGKVADSSIKVVAPATHDSGSAVAAVPYVGEDAIWISSGTWSILGIEVKEPIVTRESLAANFTNEGGVDGTYRFCKNVMGLWLLQQCKVTWEGQGLDVSYAELASQAERAEAFVACFDPDHESLLAPGDIPGRIARLIRDSGQRVPESPAQFARVIFESLALKYRQNLEQLTAITGRKFIRIHIVGGGSQNSLLNQLTADICGIPVYAGPAEATAVGNLVMQMVALGAVSEVAAGRQLIQSSFEYTIYEPRGSQAGERQIQFFKELISS